MDAIAAVADGVIKMMPGGRTEVLPATANGSR
jgi:hypothetical protein